MLETLPRVISTQPTTMLSTLDILTRNAGFWIQLEQKRNPAAAAAAQTSAQPKEHHYFAASSGGGGSVVIVPDLLNAIHPMIVCSVASGGINPQPTSTVAAILADPKGVGAKWFGLMFSANKYAGYTLPYSWPQAKLERFTLSSSLWPVLAATTAQLLAQHVVLTTAAGLTEQARMAARLLCGLPASASGSKEAAKTAAEARMTITPEAAAAAVKVLGPQATTLLQLYARNLYVMSLIIMVCFIKQYKGMLDEYKNANNAAMQRLELLFPAIPRAQYPASTVLTACLCAAQAVEALLPHITAEACDTSDAKASSSRSKQGSGSHGSTGGTTSSSSNNKMKGSAGGSAASSGPTSFMPAAALPADLLQDLSKRHLSNIHKQQHKMLADQRDLHLAHHMYI